jgi:hypothetical protein
MKLIATVAGGVDMKKRFCLSILCFLVIACQLFTPLSDSSKETTSAENTAAKPDAGTTSVAPPKANSPTPLETVPDAAPVLPFSPVELKEWQETAYNLQGDTLPVRLEDTRNPPVVAELTQDQRNFLAANGFTVIHSQEEQFGDIREQVSRQFGQPYYLTTDAAYHTLHLTFDELLRLMEKDILLKEVAGINQSMLDKATFELKKYRGTSLEADLLLAQAYLAVGLQLLQDEAQYDGDIARRIKPQIDQIMAGEGRDKSRLIPGFEDDYGAYKPVGHYSGDTQLENYFRGMTWFGRVAFKYKDIENPEFVPGKTPLILTILLRESAVNNQPAIQSYSRVMETLAFLIGLTDDGGPVETGALMDAVYGQDATLEDLMDETKWQIFLSSVDSLPSPRINSTFVNSTKALNAERSWRFMGQRFTIDGMILQNMIYDKVGTDEIKREFPSGLDVMAVLGSDAALQAQEAAGETKYANYTSQIEFLRETTLNQPPFEWLDSFYSLWLYAFFPQVKPKSASYPPLMNTIPWQNREITSALGSWAELKHDTALYAKMPEFMGGGGPPASPAPPGYVEPNPNVFYRLSFAAKAIHSGLEQRDFTLELPEFTGSGGDLTLYDLWQGMGQLSETFEKLGDIAAKELRSESLSVEEYELIQSPLGVIEDHVEFAKKTGQDMEMPPVPVIAAISGAGNEVLQVGVGNVDRIYVVVPIDGKLAIAQGGVFSYYEFKQPRSNRLTDEDWIEKISLDPPTLLIYTKNYILPGGKPVDALAFRVGDVYIITEKGGSPPLNMRAAPSKTASVVELLKTDTYLEIIEGPEQSGGLFWWKVRVFGSEKEGWVAQNQEWYVRAYGQ